MLEYLDILMFVFAVFFLLRGYPVAFTLAGVGLLFAFFGILAGTFDTSYFLSYPKRIFGIMSNEVLIAVPLFIFMGVTLERSRIAEKLLETMGGLFGSLRGGLGISVSLVGALLAASTGIVGATVVTMGLLSLPTMLKRGYCPKLACGSICAAGTLGQIIPPSIVLVILGDQISNAYQSARLQLGDFSPTPVSVGDLFAGSLFPGLTLVAMYIGYQIIKAFLQPETSPALEKNHSQDPTSALLMVLALLVASIVFMIYSPVFLIVLSLNLLIGFVAYKEFSRRPVSYSSKGVRAEVIRILSALIPPLALIVSVLGSILQGVATPTEAAAVGAIGAIFLAGLNIDSGVYAKDIPPQKLNGRQVDTLLLLLFRTLGRFLDRMRNAPIYLAILSIIDVLYLRSVFDLRLTRDVIDADDQKAIYFAYFLCGFIVWGLLVSLGRIAAQGILRDVMRSTTQVTTMVFVILIGASLFSLVFRGLGGEEKVHEFLSNLPGGRMGALILVMLVMFFLGFFLDFLEIVFVVVPIVAPVLFKMDFDPVWLGVMMAINLQTSFLTPPFGFALFYLRGVAPKSVTTGEIYRGVVPFIIIQMLGLLLLALFPPLATWLPNMIYG